MNKTIINLLLVLMFLMSSIPLGLAQTEPGAGDDFEYKPEFKEDYKVIDEGLEIDDAEYSTDYIPEEIELDERLLIVGRILKGWLPKNEKKLMERYCPRDGSAEELAKIDKGAEVVLNRFIETNEKIEKLTERRKKVERVASLEELKKEFVEYCSVPPEQTCNKFAERFMPRGPGGQKIKLTCPPNEEDFINTCKAEMEKMKEKVEKQITNRCEKDIKRESKNFERMCKGEVERKKANSCGEEQYYDRREKTCKDRPKWEEMRPPKEDIFRQPRQGFCGDGVCNEDPFSCKEDCGDQQPRIDRAQQMCKEGEVQCYNERGEKFCSVGSCPQPSIGQTCPQGQIKCPSPDGRGYCAVGPCPTTQPPTGYTPPPGTEGTTQPPTGETTQPPTGYTPPPGTGETTQPPTGYTPPPGYTSSSNEYLNGVASFQRPEDFERFKKEGDFDFGEGKDFGPGGPGDDFGPGGPDFGPGFGPGNNEGEEPDMRPEQACGEDGSFNTELFLNQCLTMAKKGFADRIEGEIEGCKDRIEPMIEGAYRFCDRQERCAEDITRRCTFLEKQNKAVEALLRDKLNRFAELREVIKEEFRTRCGVKEFANDDVISGLEETDLGTDTLNYAKRKEATEVAKLKVEIQQLTDQLKKQQEQLNVLTSLLQSLLGSSENVKIGSQLEARATDLDAKIKNLKELADQATSEDEKTAFLSAIQRLENEKAEVQKQAEENKNKVGLIGALLGAFTGKATLVPTPFN